jgi:hypothetical protein
VDIHNFELLPQPPPRPAPPAPRGVAVPLSLGGARRVLMTVPNALFRGTHSATPPLRPSVVNAASRNERQGGGAGAGARARLAGTEAGTAAGGAVVW